MSRLLLQLGFPRCRRNKAQSTERARKGGHLTKRRFGLESLLFSEEVCDSLNKGYAYIKLVSGLFRVRGRFTFKKTRKATMHTEDTFVSELPGNHKEKGNKLKRKVAVYQLFTTEKDFPGTKFLKKFFFSHRT